MKKELTAENLKSELWNSLLGIQKGELDPQKGNAIANLSKQICSVTYLQLNANRYGKEIDETSVNKFVGTIKPTKQIEAKARNAK